MTEPHPPSAAVLSLAELLAWEREELEAWEAFFAAHPEAFDLPFAPDGDPRMATVRGAVHHVVVVERRYADRLWGDPVTAYEDVAAEPAEALFAAARDANARVAAWAARATDDELARVISFDTLTGGSFRTTTRKMAGHAVLHGIRTWAQLATLVRMHGLPTGRGHDLLFSRALD